MTIPTQLTHGATTHIKDGLPVTTVSNLGMLTPAAEALIMSMKAGLETVASTLNVTLPTVAETAAQLNETTAIAHANTTANQQNAADIAALSTSTTQAVEGLQASISSLESSISAKIAENVVTAATVEMTSTGQVKLNVDKKNLNTGATSSSFTTIPVASAGSNGIMPKESYQAINDLQSRVSSLESGGVWRATFATYQALVDRYPDLDVSSTTWTANDYVEVESDSNYDDDPTRYVVVVNGQVKTLVFQKRMQAAVQIATTSATGVVLGSADTAANKYKIFVENDGSMDLIGADDIEANLSVAVPYSSVVGESVSQYKIVEKDGLLFRANSAILEVPAVFDPTAWTQVGGRDMELDEVTISKNEDDELQAIGVIEKNQGNTKYDWVGTYQEWLDQDVAEEHPEWLCYITDDATDLLFANDIFDFKRTDRLLDSLYWVRADDFAWHDGQKYNAMYQHLLDDWNNGTLQTETVNGHTFQYMLAPDKHKLFSTNGDGEEIAQTLFEETGIAWYYIIDLNSPRFKLPRNSFDFVGYRTGAGNYVPESVPNVKGSVTISNGEFYNDQGALKKDETSYPAYGAASATNAPTRLTLDASRSSSAYQNNAPVQQRAVETFLYFFTGNYTKDAITQAAYLNGEMFDAKANTSLNNLEDSGKNIANWSSSMTNCITKIPQDIKVEIGTGANAGKLIVKAGTKKTVPSGDGVFVQEVIPDDIIGETGSGTGDFFVFVNIENVGLVTPPANLLWSGDAVPTTFTSGYAMWYDTDANDIKFTSDSGSTWKSGYSFPLAVVHRENGVYTYVVETFNGFGLLASTRFCLPGVEWNSADGTNLDGTPRNQHNVLTHVVTETHNVANSKCIMQVITTDGTWTTSVYVESETMPDVSSDRYVCWYKPSEHIIRFHTPSSGWLIGESGAICYGTFQTDANKRITNFRTKKPFVAVDANEADYVIQYQIPNASNNYTWFRLYKSGWIEQGGLPTTSSTIVFPKEMLDVYYWSDVHVIANTSNGMTFSTRGYNMSTTGFSYNNATMSIDAIRWEVKGFAKI